MFCFMPSPRAGSRLARSIFKPRSVCTNHHDFRSFARARTPLHRPGCRPVEHRRRIHQGPHAAYRLWPERAPDRAPDDGWHPRAGANRLLSRPVCRPLPVTDAAGDRSIVQARHDLDGGQFRGHECAFRHRHGPGDCANAIFLQYSAPLWMYLAAVFLLGEQPDRRGTVTLLIGMCGIAIIVLGGSRGDDMLVVAIALGSGFTYAGVLIGLRVLRHESSRWLTVWNHLLGALLLLPLLISLRPPSLPQFATLFLYGSLQMGLAYWLVAHGLSVVSPQEAGTITLLEPILNPIWAYLVAPETELPGPFTLLGGAVILTALAWRYWPRRPALCVYNNDCCKPFLKKEFCHGSTAWSFLCNSARPRHL